MQKGLWVGAGLLLLILIVVFSFNNSGEQNITGELARNIEGESLDTTLKAMGGNNTNATFDSTPPTLTITSSGVDSVANAGWVKFEAIEDKTFPTVRIYGPIEYTGAIRDYLQCSSLICIGNLDFAYSSTLDPKGDNYKVEAINGNGLSVVKEVTLRFANEGSNQTNTTCTNECDAGLMCSNSYLRYCGNYDADICLEWSESAFCQYGCGSSGCASVPNNQTTCTSSTCSNLGKQCGNWNNGTCSGSIFCGNCQSGYNCNSNGQCAINNQTNNDTTAPNLGVSPGISTPLGVAYLFVSAGDDQGMDFVQVVGPIESTSLARDKEYCSSNNCLVNLSFSYDPTYDNGGNNYKVYAYNKAGLSSGLVVSIAFKDETQTNQTCVSNVSQVCADKNCGAVFDQTCWQWVSCGTCSSGYTCVNNQCIVETNQTCTPEPLAETCYGLKCGSKINNCGQNVVCGTCSTGQFCDAAGICNSFTCTDSDGGKNYNVAGTVLFNGLQKYTDYCNSTRILNEYSCTDRNMMDFNAYACPYGCENTANGGKCKAAPSIRK